MLRPLHRRPGILLPSLLSKFSSTSSASLPPPPPPPLADLRATAPSHNALILLCSSYPPSTFPARGPKSQVLKQLQVRAVKWGGVVNWVWDQARDASEQKAAGVEKESYRATVFSKYGRLEVPRVSSDNVDVVGEEIQQFACDGPGSREQEKRQRDEAVHLLVCTHAARDCRCGVLGGAFVQALREEVERVRDLKIKINIGEVAHVGGHKYAPNLLIYPYGDWYGLLSPAQVPQILANIRATAETRGVRALEGTEELVLASHELREHWRGRMGMSKGEQALLAEKIGLEMPPLSPT